MSKIQYFRIKRHQTDIIISCIIFALIVFCIKKNTIFTGVIQHENCLHSNNCIVIDAGHGGIDPGKVGINGALEKNINLAIAQKVKTYLESDGIKVIMTREDDNGLYNDSDTNKKVCDMKKRLTIIESSHPALAVSIHQNSYPDESISGVQVFYYKDSPKGETAALIMQQQLTSSLKPLKQREAKQNSSYYLLKKTSHPLIIVECGFLSNKYEASFLISEEYQDKIAWAIHLGIVKYLNSQNI